jgi:protein-tyrosine phosphatase
LNTPHTDIRLEGAPNFRDLGGHVTADGRTVRRGRIYRSDALSQLTAADLERIRALGISLVCDIRSPQERQEAPNPWLAEHGVDEIHIDTSAELKHANEGMIEKLRNNPTPERARELMHQVYRSMPQAFSGKLHTLINRLVSGNGLPLIIHCTAGKDRTGFVCAMLLFALDVPQSAVYNDFMLSATPERSSQLREGARRAMAHSLGEEPHPDVVDALVGVDPEYLDLALDTLTASYGSVNAYLERAGGLDRTKRAALMQALLA